MRERYSSILAIILNRLMSVFIALFPLPFVLKDWELGFLDMVGSNLFASVAFPILLFGSIFFNAKITLLYIVEGELAIGLRKDRIKNFHVNGVFFGNHSFMSFSFERESRRQKRLTILPLFRARASYRELCELENRKTESDII